jgi:hypothetical protein
MPVVDKAKRGMMIPDMNCAFHPARYRLVVDFSEPFDGLFFLSKRLHDFVPVTFPQLAVELSQKAFADQRNISGTLRRRLPSTRRCRVHHKGETSDRADGENHDKDPRTVTTAVISCVKLCCSVVASSPCSL